MFEAFEGGEPTRVVRPETGPAKSRQLNEANASALHLEASARAAFWEQSQKAPSSLWAASSQLLDVTAFPVLSRKIEEKNGQKSQGRRKRRKASRGAPQTMPSDGTAPSGKAEATSQDATSVTDSGNTRAWLTSVKNQTAVRKEGRGERRR